MSKRLVVCCDGTWNAPDERRTGVAAPTNVAKLALGLQIGDGGGQRVYYEAGVGTTPDDRVLGGVFGYGLSRNIRNCYRFLALNYEKGDQLFLFGFSRGAYTARSLAGLIRNCGILKAENADQVDDAFGFYRDRTSQTHPDAVASQIFREMYAHTDEDIYFIGVWDTVGALGIPTELPGWDWLSQHVHGWETLWGFHDPQLSSHVKYAYHALAIDETRDPFKPTLWSQDPAAVGQTLEQVWFSGVHTEVGGGSSDSALSDIALLWMIDKAKACGLEFKPNCLTPGGSDGGDGHVSPNYAGPLTDSRHGAWAAMHPYHRLTQVMVRSAPDQFIASSAVRRAADEAVDYHPEGFDHYQHTVDVINVVEEV
ncbi:MAG: DUF2235 domain-containing protein [Solirubrobacteraceae bacterium]